MRRFGLIGYPLSHSFSPKYFADKFSREGIIDCRYDLLEIPTIEEVQQLLDGSIEGINVTIPYKEQILPYLNAIDAEAEAIGAVNTIKISDGEIKGYNSDIYGFEHSLLALLDGERPEGALILGTGGASKAVKYVLDKCQIAYKVVSRSRGDLLYSELTDTILNTHELIINTTPLGTYPNILAKPQIPYNNLSNRHFLFDLTYNPRITAFMQEGIDRGAKTLNGYRMLELQAEKSWAIWNNLPI